MKKLFEFNEFIDILYEAKMNVPPKFIKKLMSVFMDDVYNIYNTLVHMDGIENVKDEIVKTESDVDDYIANAILNSSEIEFETDGKYADLIIELIVEMLKK